jgi:hypothetical protein
MSPRSAIANLLVDGMFAGLASAALLAWRGRRDNASAVAPLNAPAHWFFGRESLAQDDPSWRHTVTGLLVHQASSLFWAGFYELLQARRRRTTPANALGDAALVTVVAAGVDLRIVPPRLTPGFEQRLRRPSLAGVYVAFGLGLALARLVRQH